MDYKKIFMGVSQDTIDEALKGICRALIGKGLTFRQAGGLIEMAKEKLKDAKI